MNIDIQSIILAPPVEEMYHRVLVTTIDSVLDARFNTGCCEEVIDSDNINVAQDTDGNILLPFNH